MLPVEKSVTFTGSCVNEIIPSIDRSFVYKAKEGGHVRIIVFINFFQEDKIYVQHRILENKLMLWDILEKGGWFFVAGYVVTFKTSV